jgi:hypothetical protein
MMVQLDWTGPGQGYRGKLFMSDESWSSILKAGKGWNWAGWNWLGLPEIQTETIHIHDLMIQAGLRQSHRIG